MYYIGLDVHKKTISYCMKDASGQVNRQGRLERHAMNWMPGWRLYRSPGWWRWKQRFSQAGFTITCFRMLRRQRWRIH
jgi:hypothetical protein